MSNDEKNAHVNFCLEGKGDIHKNNYLSSIKLLKITIGDECKKDENNSDEENKFCPFCNKSMINNNLEENIQEKHMLNCYAKMEKDLLLQNKRKRKNC